MFGIKTAGAVHIGGGGRLFEPIIADVNVGILLIFALASVSVYGIVTAGWASANKFSLFGGIRASAQMISYELALALAAVSALMVAGSLRLTDVVARQTGYFVLFDSVKIPFRPEAVVRVRREAEVGVVLELANKHRVPVTTRGRGTTLTGSATPVRGGWVVDTLALDKISIDDEAGMAHVQAGAKIADIQRAAEAKGWFYPPDPSSKEYAATRPAGVARSSSTSS